MVLPIGRVLDTAAHYIMNSPLQQRPKPEPQPQEPSTLSHKLHTPSLNAMRLRKSSWGLRKGIFLSFVGARVYFLSKI